MFPAVHWLRLRACGILSLAGLTTVLTENALAAEKVLRIGTSFGPNSSTPDPRARHNGWMSNRAGVSETLIGLDYNMEQFPRLAESYENLSPTEWKVILREGIKFHDGSVMHAEDVKSSFEKLSVEGQPWQQSAAS